MKKKTIPKVIISFIIILQSNTYLFSSETMDTSFQQSIGEFKFFFYGNSLIKDIFFTIQNDEIKVLDNNGNVVTRYFSTFFTEYKCNSTGQQGILKIAYNPFGGLVWWGKFGMSKYSLYIPTSSTKYNALKMSKPGVVAGIGFRYQLLPDTIVTPALGITFETSISEHIFDVLWAEDNNIYLINDNFEYSEIQMGFSVSKRYKIFEPYGGIKIKRDFSKISRKDNNIFDEVSGHKDRITIYTGAKLKVSQKESIMIEGNFLGEMIWSIGLGAEF